jgi:lactate dehydrogenase-like 2-hydroxyacid dehydrogenase
MKKFKKVIILDSVILYPEHRIILNSLADEIIEYPSSLPESLERQYRENPQMFNKVKCYTELANNNTPLQLLMNRLEGADVIISCWTSIPDEILRLNPQLKLIIFWTHEKEHRINLKLAEELGITVTNIPDYGTNSVSEVVFAGLWKILGKNYQQNYAPTNDNEIAFAVIGKIFDVYRKLSNNEKNTRSGKFTHHFHKLGYANFDFTKNKLDDLIPEKLIESKQIGLLNIKNIILNNFLSAFNVRNREFQLTDSNLAEYYKFIAENDYIFYDSKFIDALEVLKLKLLAPEKVIDIQSLVTINYTFGGKIFGIVGLGRIGQKVAKIARDLGFKVIYYSKAPKPEIEKSLNIYQVSLEELIKTSDIVSIHVPAYKAENLIDENLISSLKEKAIFINTADGNSVDQLSLTNRMINKQTFSYLDVYQGLPRKDILGLPMTDKTDWKLKKELDNNVLAYRAGWKSQESIRVKTYKLIGELIDYIINKHDSYVLPKEL